MSDMDQTELEGVVAAIPDWFRNALAVPRKEGFVEVEGCPIHYFEWGDRANPGVILVHGILANARCYAFIAPLLARDYHLVAFDFSGDGDSGARERYPEEIRAREVIRIAQETGLFDGPQPPYIVAHSYGSTMVMRALEMAGERFGGTLFCEMMVLRPERLERFRKGSASSARVERPHRPRSDLQSVIDTYTLAPPQEVENEYILQYIARHAVRRIDEGWIWKFSPSIWRDDPRTNEWWQEQALRLVRVKGRKAFLFGEESILFDRDSISYLKELGLTEMPIAGIPGAHHHLMIDQPLAFTAAIRSVLAGWDAAG